MKIYLKIYHNGEEWIAYNNEIEIKAKSIKDLDEKLRNHLKRKYGSGIKVKILMEYDYEKFPFWIIQYHPFYFYRELEFET